MSVFPPIFVMLVLLLPLPAAAQELTPRAYWPAPEGTRLGSVGYLHSSGDTVPDPSLPVSGVDSSIDALYLGYLQTLDLWGRTANFIVEVPFSDGSTAAAPIEGDQFDRHYRGMGDISATLSVNFLGAPTMDASGFAELRMDPVTIIGGSIKVISPSGEYESDRVVNISGNRWAAKVELGAIFPLHPRWLLEVAAGRFYFGDNDNFLGTTRKQRAINSYQLHLVRRLRAGFWVSLDYNYYHGGRSTIDNRRLDDIRRDSKAGVTMVFPFFHKNAIKVGYSKGSLNDSNEDFDYFLIAYQRLF